MKVLSLFDGISCARVALERANIPVEIYSAFEIDKYAIQISKKNYPDILQNGSVIDCNFSASETKYDLLIGGSPCQDLSIAKKNRKGLSGERSGLFYEYVRILEEVKPKYFILENVASMPKEARQMITETLGVEPIMIDAALVSAQRRKRLFWTNIPNVTLPEDKGIFLRDILDGEDTLVDTRQVSREKIPRIYDKGKSPALNASMWKTPYSVVMKEKSNTIRSGGRGSGLGDRHDWDSIYQYRRTYWRKTEGGKVSTLTANMGTGGHNVPFIQQTPRGYNKGGKKFDKVPTLTKNAWEHNHKLNGIRKLTPIECERLQGLAEIEQSCIIRICLGNQNNSVSVVDRNLKSQLSVGNVGKDKSKENVKSATQSFNTNNPQTSRPAQPDVLINCEENKIEIYNQNKLIANVSGAELKNLHHHLKSIGDFVHLVVGLNIIVEKITPFGEVELPQKSSLLVVKESGNNVVNIYGKGITQLAKDVESDSTTLNKLLKSTISDLSIQENNEQIIQTLFSYVASVIVGYIPKEIQNQNTLTLQIKSKVGYTFGVSNTQRYKALGNAFNVDVIAHILSFISSGK